jgi:hypothetical protein
MRFDVFPHTPDALKMQMSRTLLRLNYAHPEVQILLNQAFAANRATVFRTFTRRRGHFRSLCYTIDYDTILAIYWAEPDPTLATNILSTLIKYARHMEEALFVTTEFNGPWAIAVNLLVSARNAEEKEAALVFLTAYQDTMPMMA